MPAYTRVAFIECAIFAGRLVRYCLCSSGGGGLEIKLTPREAPTLLLFMFEKNECNIQIAKQAPGNVCLCARLQWA